MYPLIFRPCSCLSWTVKQTGIGKTSNACQCLFTFRVDLPKLGSSIEKRRLSSYECSVYSSHQWFVLWTCSHARVHSLEILVLFDLPTILAGAINQIRGFKSSPSWPLAMNNIIFHTSVTSSIVCVKYKWLETAENLLMEDLISICQYIICSEK